MSIPIHKRHQVNGADLELRIAFLPTGRIRVECGRSTNPSSLRNRIDAWCREHGRLVTLSNEISAEGCEFLMIGPQGERVE